MRLYVILCITVLSQPYWKEFHFIKSQPCSQTQLRNRHPCHFSYIHSPLTHRDSQGSYHKNTQALRAQKKKEKKVKHALFVHDSKEDSLSVSFVVAAAWFFFRVALSLFSLSSEFNFIS